jgi:hypothetical protein
VAEPRDADALTHTEPLDTHPDRIDPTDDFVAGRDRHLRVGQLTIDDVQIRAAYAAGGHLHAYLTWPRLSIRELGPFQSRSKFL